MRYLHFHGGNTGSNPVRVATPSALAEGLEQRLCGLFDILNGDAPRCTKKSGFEAFSGSKMAANWQ